MADNASAAEDDHEAVVVPRLAIARVPPVVGLGAGVERVSVVLGPARGLGHGRVDDGGRGATAGEGELAHGERLGPGVGEDIEGVEVLERDVVRDTTKHVEAKQENKAKIQYWIYRDEMKVIQNKTK